MIDKHGEYKHEKGQPGRHLTTLEGEPRPRYTPEEMRRRMALVPLTQAMQRGEEQPASPNPHPAAQANEPEVDQEGGWETRAECRKTDPDAYFPEKGGSSREAKKVCLSCDVQSECLEYALAHNIRFGVWGGLSERERRKLKKRVV